MSALRITLDITSAVKPQPTGIGNYVVDLVRALLAAKRGHFYSLGIRPKRFLRKRYFPSLADVPGGSRVPILPLVPPWYGVFAGRIDVFHALGVRLPRFGKFLKVVTIHDLNTLDRPDLTRPDWAENRGARIRETIARADGIVVPSAFTKQRILEVFSVPEAKIRVVHHGVDLDRYRPRAEREIEAARKKFNLDRPYMLHVGAFVPRKNKEALVRAFALSKARRDGALLVLAGSKRGNFEEIAKLAASCGLGDAVRYPGFVDRDEVAALLSGARMSVYSSHYEGFGLPVLEAMACGAPVAVARASCLPEVGGDAAAYFDLGSDEAIAAALDELWTNEPRRHTLAQAGCRRAQDFTWARAAQLTHEFYEQLAGRGVGPAPSTAKHVGAL